MSERNAFLGWVGSRLKDAEMALHSEDAAPLFDIGSNNDPVTVLGAWMSGGGQPEVGDLSLRLHGNFSTCSSYSHNSSRPT